MSQQPQPTRTGWWANHEGDGGWVPDDEAERAHAVAHLTKLAEHGPADEDGAP